MDRCLLELPKTPRLRAMDARTDMLLDAQTAKSQSQRFQIPFTVVAEMIRAAEPAEVCLWNFWWNLIWDSIRNLKSLMGKIWWSFGGRTFRPARKAPETSERISGQISEQISGNISETSFQISRLFSETSFSRRAALRNDYHGPRDYYINSSQGNNSCNCNCNFAPQNNSQRNYLCNCIWYSLQWQTEAHAKIISLDN